MTTKPERNRRGLPVFSAGLMFALGTCLFGLPPAPSAAAGPYRCDNLAKTSPLSRLAVEIYQGSDGWFARSADLETMFEYPPQTMQMLVRLNEALRAKGVHLIMLPMLPKGIAGRDFLPPDGIFGDRVYDPDLASRQFDRLIDSIHKAGIDIVNIDKVVQAHPEFDLRTFYFKRDIHWTPEASRLIAGAVAKAIRKAEPDNPAPLTFDTPPSSGKRLIQSNMNMAINELCQEKIPGEYANIYDTKQSVDSVDSLLGDDPTTEDHSINVVGTSFTDELLVNHFDGFLRQALGQNVDGFSVAGGGETQSIYAWANSDTGLARHPKVLVWEIHDAGELITQTPYIRQTLVPAIIGDCSASTLSDAKEFPNKGSVDFDLSAHKPSGSRYYLRYKFANNSLRSFKLTLNFADNTNQVVTIANPTRIQDVDKLYYELPDDVPAAVTSVNLQISDGMTSSGTVKLCRHPDGIFSTATSN